MYSVSTFTNLLDFSCMYSTGKIILNELKTLYQCTYASRLPTDIYPDVAETQFAKRQLNKL